MGSDSGVRPLLLSTLFLTSLALVLTSLALGAASPLAAQGAPLVLEIPGSVRASGLGGAYLLQSPLPDILFVQTGAIGDARGTSAAYQDFGPNGRGFNAAGAMAWWGGGVAVGVQTLSYSAASEDPASLPPLQSAVGADNLTPVSETAVTLGYGRSAFGLDFGAAVKLVDMRLGAARSGSAAFDAGAAADLGPVRLAVSVQNLGSALEFPGGSLDLPVRVGGGVSAPIPSLGPLDFTGAVNAFRLGDGSADVGGGAEVRYWPVVGRTFIGRVGYRHVSDDANSQGLTLGAGFAGDDIRIDYAWQEGGAAGDVHRFGIGWR